MLRTSDKMLDPSTDKENSLVVTTKFVIYQFLLHCDRRDFELSVGIWIASVGSVGILIGSVGISIGSVGILIRSVGILNFQLGF